MRKLVLFAAVVLPFLACSPAQPQRAPAPALPEVLPRVAEVGDGSWTVPVTEGTRVIEYPFVPPDAREGNRIELVEDLRIGDGANAGADDENYLFNKPYDIAVDDQGRIYAADGADRRVLVFDANGVYLRTMGTAGEGPGEYEWPASLAIVGHSLAVSDGSIRTLTIWDLDGEYQSESRFDFRGQVFHMYGLADGTLIGSFPEMASRGGRLAVAKFDQDGQELLRIASLRRWRPPGITRRIDSKNSVSRGLPVATAQPWFVASSDGDVYLTGGDEYQVLALGSQGAPRWALRVPWPHDPVSREEIEAVLDLHRGGQLSDETLAGVRWPEIRPALAGYPMYPQNDRPLQLDGHGHLYVFPYFPVAWQRDDRLRPVDVYSKDGELLFAGMIPNRDWVTAHGDHVYGFEEDAEENLELVRYRLVEPF